jgi:hypothetical protein
LPPPALFLDAVVNGILPEAAGSIKIELSRMHLRIDTVIQDVTVSYFLDGQVAAHVFDLIAVF